MTKEPNSIEDVLTYHRRTKHHLHRYAAGPGYLDWDTQPDPFRTFTGAERVQLPLLADRLGAAYPDLYRPGAVPPVPLDRNSVAMLFELALGLSAWKEYLDSRWALRCNPSSGNLHPTEGYAILPEMPGLNAGVYHYVSRDHCLERRCVPEGRAAQQLTESFPPACFLVGLSSIHWREAWKYGERAFRYCQHDGPCHRHRALCGRRSLGWSAELVADVRIRPSPPCWGWTSQSLRSLPSRTENIPTPFCSSALPASRKVGKQAGLTLQSCGIRHAGAGWPGQLTQSRSCPLVAIDAAAVATWQDDRAGLETVMM